MGLLASVLLACLLFIQCKGKTESTTVPPSVQVELATVVEEDVPIFSEWVGTTEGMINAVIRAQVTGYLVNRPYTEGAFVKKGTVLFELDPSKYKAALDQALGEAAKAEAQLIKAKQDVDRDTPLAGRGAISRKELDDSKQAYAAAKGMVAASRAAVEQARVNLGWTKIVAPIDGVVGIAKAQIGDLVDGSSELTSMSNLDPIKVYFPISEEEYMLVSEKVVRRYQEKERGQDHQGVPLDLILGGNKVYPHRGRIFLVDRQVDVKTGTIRVAAIFPNPNNILRPGQFARVRALTDSKEKAIVVPQRAVRETQGRYQVAVVTSDNKVEIRPITVGKRSGGSWIIDEGLRPGERVIVEGLQKVKAGMQVAPRASKREQEPRTT